MPTSSNASNSGDPEPRFSRGRKSRGRGLRKTTGCLTCRRRHISCDEAKPVCSGCTRARQTCTYRQANPEKTTSNKQTVASNSSRRRGLRGSVDCAEVQTVLPVTTPDDYAGMSEISQPTQPSPLEQQLDDITVGNDISTPPVQAVLGLPADNRDTRAQHIVVNQQAPAAAAVTSTTTITASASTAGTPSATPQAAVQAANTPSSSHSYHSPGQTRHNYAPSVVSSGRMSFSQDALGSSLYPIVPANVESATAQWLGLLISDATQYTDGGLPSVEWDDETIGPDLFGSSAATESMSTQPILAGSLLPSLRTHPNSSHRTLQERVARLRGEQQLLEVQAWYSSSPIELTAHERFLLGNFVEKISCVMDLFDPKRSFGTFVPHLAIHNVGLFNAVMALSERHLSLGAKESGGSPEMGTDNRPNPNEAIRYYYKTLHYIQKAMEYDTYKTSLELLATTMIVSTYEMLDGSRRDWERHLKGVFGIQRSQVIHGDSGGLRQAVWWSWLCQDVWAAFRERRKPRTFWQPKRTLDELDPYEVAARSVLLFAHVVAFCSTEAIDEHRASPAARMAKADALLASLEDWRRHHTVEFDPLPMAQMPGDAFEPLWIHPPAFGVAMQIYYCALILITLNRPLIGDLDAYLQQRKHIQRYVSVVCGIGMTLTEDSSCVMCSQCLFIAGLAIEDPKRQLAVLDMLERCRQRALWPATPLGEELTRKWQDES